MLIKLQISCNFLKPPKSPARDGLGRRWEFEAIGNTPVGHENSPLGYQRKRTATDSNGRRLLVRRETAAGVGRLFFDSHIEIYLKNFIQIKRYPCFFIVVEVYYILK